VRSTCPEFKRARAALFRTRVWFHDANGRLRALPSSWTSVVGEDPFNVVAAGRALFRVEELLELGRLIATLEP